jgi:Zn-dependent M28 family amino/carboxypeptidase
MKQGMIGTISRTAAGCLLGALMAQGAMAQSNIVNRINTAMFQKYHQGLFVNANQNRGFTANADSTIVRKPTKQHDLARNFIASSLASLGYATKLQPFDFYTTFAGTEVHYTNCNNIVATIPGTDPANAGYYIISAYYDTLDAGQPCPTNGTIQAFKSAGADMNATGIAALLCLAEALRGQKLRATVILVAFDASQKYFAGAQYFLEKSTTTTPGGTAKKIDQALIRAMVNIDTIGYGRKADGSLSTTLLYGGAAVPTKMRKKLGGALTRYGGLTPVQGGTSQSSDSVVFWNAGIEASSVHEAALWENPNLYTATDCIGTPKVVNYAYAVKITRGVAGFLCERAGLQ